MVKRYVLDTSVLIHDPISLFQFEDNEVIIPATVIEELNKLKDDTDRLRGITAQNVLKSLDKLSVENPDLIRTGISLDSGGKLLVEMNHISFDKLRGTFDEKTNDNKILAVAKNYTDESTGSPVILVTNDVSMRVKARALGIKSEGYDSDRLVTDLDGVYKGFKNLNVSDKVINKFYKDGYIGLKELKIPDLNSVYVNEFLVLENEINKQHVAVGIVKLDRGKKILRKLLIDKSTSVYGISPKDLQQTMCLELLMDDDIKMVSVIGKAGTGKTLLSLAAGLSKVQDECKYRRVLALRTLVTVGKKEVGFLPGELKDKLYPFMQPIYDNLEYLDSQGKGQGRDRGKKLSLDDILQGMTDQLQIESTGFMRGRSLPSQFIIVDEAQNLTKHEVKTLITRVGEGAKIVLMGDPTQIDDPYLDSVNNGLIYATEKLKSAEITGTVKLEGKSKRSELAELASNNL